MKNISAEIGRKDNCYEVIGCPIIISRLVSFPGVLPNKYTRTLEEFIYKRAPNEASSFAISEVVSLMPDNGQGVYNVEYVAVQFYGLKEV